MKILSFFVSVYWCKNFRITRCIKVDFAISTSMVVIFTQRVYKKISEFFGFEHSQVIIHLLFRL